MTTYGNHKAEDGRAQEHQEGGVGGEAEEDDLQAAEEHAHGAWQAGEQGQEAEVNEVELILQGGVELGYTLSSEERQPEELVGLARAAEDSGFAFALISDHYHPWTDRQGSSPFAWSVLGGIAAQTSRLRVGTGVTCPTIRYHPAIIAQAAATVARLMQGRFFLGVGSGESLNEHITGNTWPTPDVRQEMLEEAIEVIRMLHEGG